MENKKISSNNSNLRKPSWITSRLNVTSGYSEIRKTLRKYRLHTICEDALCPNKGECWSNKHATFLILGNICTRHCLFCNVTSGNPQGKIDEEEPERIAQAIQELDMKYIIITSTTRDDLSDGGAFQYVKTLRLIKSKNSSVQVEFLIPDFNNQENSLKLVVQEKPAVIAHNIETVRRLTPIIRHHSCSYENSLQVLRSLKQMSRTTKVKSGLMIGLGESLDEIRETIREIRETGTDIITIGQYLAPSKNHYPVAKYYTLEEFDLLKQYAESLGFNQVLSGPLVRSSYIVNKG